jgi:TonB family protein
MNERVACLALLSAIIACASPAAPPAAPATAVSEAVDARADEVAGSDPGVRGCELDVEDCSGVALVDPDPAWQTGLARLADARALQCQQGDAAGCYRAWQYGLRCVALLRRGCALGLDRACWELGYELHRVEHDPAPMTPLVACQRGAAEACGLEGACAGPSPCAALEAKWKAAPPRLLSSNTMESRRIAGERNLLPPDVVKVQMVQVGRDKIVGTIKLCLDAQGTPERIQVIKSSGFRGYDQLLREHIRSWRYRPYEIDGAPAPVCTAVTFVYRQS